MRKALLAATAIATMFTVTSAMEVGLDIKGGLNIANVRYEEKDEDQKARLGAVAGLGAQFGLTDMFAIQPEVLFSMKGHKAEYSESIGEDKYEAEGAWKLSYLEIPVLFKFNIPAGKVTPNFYGGPSMGLNLSSKYEGEVSSTFDGTTETESFDEDVKEYTNAVDFGLAFGGGADFNVSEKGRIILDLRYSLGLSNIEKDSEDYKNKNGAFGVMLGYGFKF